MTSETSWENIHILGRTVNRPGDLNLVWSASGVEFDLNASMLGVELEGGSSSYMPWISVLLDGKWVAHIPVQEGTGRYMLFRDLDPFVTHNVRIMKDSQAMPDDPDSFLHLKKILHDGALHKPAKKRYNIEFVGDSITSGEGLIGANGLMEWISSCFGTANNYAVLTSDALDADFRLISESGWGLYASYDNSIYNVMPALYDSAEAKRNAKDYDHSSWKADAVVVNLCTNDEGSFHNPGFKDPVTGKIFKNHLLDDGSYDKNDLGNISDAVISFLKRLRESNRGAYLLWAYGMCSDAMSDTIENAVNEYKKMTGDDRAGFLLLDAADDKTIGARMHPGPLCHMAAAEKISRFLNKVL